MRDTPPCFGCGLRIHHVDKNIVVRVEEESNQEERNRRNLRTSQLIDLWRSEESICGIIWRILEGTVIATPLIILTIFYAKCIDYLTCYSDNTPMKEWDDFKVDNMGYYWLGLILALFSYVVIIIIHIMCLESRSGQVRPV